jgi:hypothetical protein
VAETLLAGEDTQALVTRWREAVTG